LIAYTLIGSRADLLARMNHDVARKLTFSRAALPSIMLDGFYSVNFKLPDEEDGGGGVVVLLNGKIYGGDTSYSYQGAYEIDGAVLTASIRVSPFNEFLKSIFADFEETEDEIKLSGSFDAEKFLLKGQLCGIEDSITVEGKRIAKVDP
jgi:hypothetical protein